MESLFARLREQSSGPTLADDELPAPAPPDESEPAAEPEPAETTESAPVAPTKSEPSIDLTHEPEQPGSAPDDDRPAASEQTGHGNEPRVTEDERADALAEVVVLGSDVADDDARAARDSVLGSLQRELGRKVKRTLQDEQNDVLDRIRTVKGRPVSLDVLPTAAAQVGVLAATLRGPVDAAYSGGRVAAGAARSPAAAPATMVDGLAATMVERLHERLVDAIDGAGEEDASITQRLGARYREFKGQELDAIVGDTLAAAWALGVYDAAPRRRDAAVGPRGRGTVSGLRRQRARADGEGRGLPDRPAAPTGPPGMSVPARPAVLTSRQPATRSMVAAF